MDEKKKILVVSALGVVMLGVGAFQFMNGSDSEPATPVSASTEAKKEEPQAKKEGEMSTLLEKQPMATPDGFVANDLPQRDPFVAASWSNTPEPKPIPAMPAPKPLDGSIAPFSPVGGGSLPPVGGDLKVTPVEPQFAYTLIGHINGAQPAAVFQDAQGGQRLVLVGKAIDAESQLVSVDRGFVTVQFHNKVLKLTLGGNSSAK